MDTKQTYKHLGEGATLGSLAIRVILLRNIKIRLTLRQKYRGWVLIFLLKVAFRFVVTLGQKWLPSKVFVESMIV